MYRTTPHSTTKIPPSELLFNSTVKGLLPQPSSKKVPNKHKIAKTNIDNRKASHKIKDKRRHAKESDIKEANSPKVTKQHRILTLNNL